MTFEMEQADRDRDRRLRRVILRMLHGSRASGPRGGLTGRTLRDVVDASVPPGQETRDDEHCLSLIRDLTRKGLIDEEPLPLRRTQRWGLDYVFIRISAKGSSLLNETIPPDPDIDDERVAEE